MTKESNTSDNNSAQQATYIQLPYPYTNGALNDDEINLADLWLALKKRTKLLIGLPLFFVLIALSYFAFKSNIYAAKMIFLPPSQANVISFNQGGIAKISPAQIYKRFSVSLLSRKNQADFFDQYNVLEKMATFGINKQNPEQASKEKVYNKLFNSISIELFSEAKPEEINKKNQKQRRFKTENNQKLQQIILTIKGKNPQLNSDLLNGLSTYVERKTVIEQIDDLNAKKELAISNLTQKIKQLSTIAKQKRLDKIKQFEEQDKIAENKILDLIRALRVKTKNSRLSEIKRLEAADRLNRKIIENKINELQVNAKIQRLDTIEKLKEALTIANNLGIKNPSYLSLDYFKAQTKNEYQPSTNLNQPFNSMGQTAALTEISRESNALYLKGEKTLTEEIKKLNIRQSDDPFIPKLRSLQGQLRELQTNEKIKALKNRTDDDPYIAELQDLQQKLSLLRKNRQLEAYRIRKDDSPFIAELRDHEVQLIKLQNLSYNPVDLRATIVSQYAFPSKKPINMVSKLNIISLSLFLGVFLAIFLALISAAIANKPIKVE